ncbi:putative exonuclease [Campylobacter phage NCTC12673]|uniref:Putative exonuclease n=2 Tax=Fletchervirus NCTC12673 TaxID=934027 RepID=A0A1B0XVZ5_9CAUD|nr:putative exonuclease [Campylobacter phage NCTC12673]YP_009321623.1 putative exonuclease [Campylobacter phage PC14]AEA86481.1 putative exonuclease [Campylobacter phage NCTC12673]ANH51317.1 putative exonuclease [Campylobacter phage PC14]
MPFVKFINEVVNDMLSEVYVTNSKTGLDFKEDYNNIESRGKKALKILHKLARGGYDSKQYYNIYSDLLNELWNINQYLVIYKNDMPWYRDELKSPKLKIYQENIRDYMDDIKQAMRELKADYASVSHISNKNLETNIESIIDEYKRLYKIVEKIALSQ